MQYTGTVKWFNKTKEFGFIKPDNSKKDIFVHISALTKAGIDDLQDNQRVEYDVIDNKGRLSAENLKILP